MRTISLKICRLHAVRTAWIAVLLWVVLPAHAHTLSESLSAWRIDGDSVRLQFTVPDLEAKRVSASGKDIPSTSQLGQYLAARVGVTAKGQKCQMTEAPRAMSASVGYFRFDMLFKCPTADD